MRTSWSIMRLVCTILTLNCLWVLLVSCFLTRAVESDINCLKTLKSQLKDPNGHLSSWVFDNKIEGFICKFNGVRCWNDEESRVLSIELGGFGLEGQFPSAVKECSALSVLNLTRNNLSGTIPSEITSFLPFLVTLDLSYNSFSGEIPVALSSITFINNLMLDHNRFTGQIPPGVVSYPRLRKFSVAYNNLKGRIPGFSNEYISRSSFDDNPDLCGFPLDPCEFPLSSMVIITAACAAAIFFPVGVAIGWFCIRIGDEQKQGPRRR